MILCYVLIKARLLIFYLDPPLCPSSVDDPLFCFQGSTHPTFLVIQFDNLCLSDDYRPDNS